MKFLVYSSEFNLKSGGAIACHQLCHLLNVLGENAFLLPRTTRGGVYVSALADKSSALQQVNIEQDYLRKVYKDPKTFSVNKNYLTPIWPYSLSDISRDSELVVIYPENIFGNPLGGKNIARWMLHHAGYFSKEVFYTFGEVIFKFHSKYKSPTAFYLEEAGFDLKVHIKLDPTTSYRDVYEEAKNIPKFGSAYLIKKGLKDGIKKYDYHPRDSILLDDLSRNEIIEVLKRVRRFYSYDDTTFYSELAAVHGAQSIIVPREGSENDRTKLPGVAYGVEDLDRAMLSIGELIEGLDAQNELSVQAVQKFRNFWASRIMV